MSDAELHGRTRHILIVDDLEAELDLLAEHIGLIEDEYGYIVHRASNADEAVRVYADKQVDCALVDYNMPDQNGVDLIRLLNMLPSHNHLFSPLPVIVISGHDDEDMLKTIRDSGAMRFMHKSDLLNATNLRLVIDAMLEGPSTGSSTESSVFG